MPRNITVTFDDGSTHVYQNAPDDITPEMVTERASKDFGKTVKALDGGRAQASQVAPEVGVPQGDNVAQLPETAPQVSPPDEVKKPRLQLPEKDTTIRDSVRSMLQGATLGFSDELGTGAAALAATGVGNVKNMLGMQQTNPELGQVYSEMQKQVSDEQNQFRSERPALAAATEIAGGVIPAIASGGTTAASTTLPAVASEVGTVGNVLNTARAAYQAANPVVKGVLTGVGTGALYGAGTAEQGNRLADAEKGALVGGITGGLVPTIAKGIGKVLSPDAAKNEALSLLKQEGVQPTIGQALGGRFNALEEKAMSLPIMGDMIAIARNKAAESIEPAAHNRALSQIGEKLPKGLKGFDAVAYTKEKLAQKYDDVLGKIGAIVPDEQFTAKTNSLSDMVSSLKIPDSEKQAFTMALDDVKSAIDNNGVMTSEGYKLAESNLSAIGRSLKGASSSNPYASKVNTAVSQLKSELQDMLKRQAGDNAEDLRKVNKAYSNFKVVEKASDAGGADMGSFTPAQLDRAARSMEKSIGKRTTGNAMMQDLSSAAKNVLSTKTPNSGTAERLFYGGGALASGAINPAIPIALGGGAALYTRPVQNALVTLATERPDLLIKAGDRLNQLAALPAASAVPAIGVLSANRGEQYGFVLNSN